MPVVRAVFPIPMLLLTGCAAVTAADGSRIPFGSAELRTYVERVFREQNKTASELAFAIEDSAPGGAGSAQLAAAEDALLAACAGLNELATSRRDEQQLGLRRSAAIARRAPECESATLAAQAALASTAR